MVFFLGNWSTQPTQEFDDRRGIVEHDELGATWNSDIGNDQL